MIDRGWRKRKDGKLFNIYWNHDKVKIPKKLYAKLTSIINTDSNKWVKGINRQIIGNTLLTFKYNGFDNFEIIKKEKYE